MLSESIANYLVPSWSITKNQHRVPTRLIFGSHIFFLLFLVFKQKRVVLMWGVWLALWVLNYDFFLSYAFICHRREDNGLLHSVHDNLPQLLQHAFEHGLLARVSVQRKRSCQKQNRHIFFHVNPKTISHIYRIVQLNLWPKFYLIQWIDLHLTTVWIDLIYQFEFGMNLIDSVIKKYCNHVKSKSKIAIALWLVVRILLVSFNAIWLLVK